MFCYQCEQTAKETGCTAFGVCGKDPDTAALQDLLMHACKGIAQYANRAWQMGHHSKEVDIFLLKAIFTTVTNVSFDPERVAATIRTAAVMRDRARAMYVEACTAAGLDPEEPGGPSAFTLADDLPGLVRQGEAVGIEARMQGRGEVLTGLEELVTYGIKGAAAYADHAQILGAYDPEVCARLGEALAFLTGTPDAEALTARALEVGGINLQVMEMLDQAHTTTYGHPEPTPVRITPVQGKAILVSGHDLPDLAALLEQTAGKGVNVYTHGEMLPAHGYPELRKHPHLVGNYGGAWQDQRVEFESFPGAILMTTNCIQKPKESYEGRIFTSGVVAWPGVTHIEGQDFSPVIEAALAAEGFPSDEPERTVMTGFGHQAVLSVADKVLAAAQAGALRHVFLIGGCDGAKPGRNYYTELAEATPPDTLVLTLACGKYRFNKLDLGELGGLPRLLDLGQCNDAYSAVKIATALADALGTDVNGLPLSLVLSWYEQKAVAILLSLLHLGIRNIRIGPSLPAFVTPPVLELLVKEFGLAPVTTPAEDLAACLGS